VERGELTDAETKGVNNDLKEGRGSGKSIRTKKGV